MRWNDRLRFRTKVTLFATGTACVALLLSATGFVFNDIQSFRRDIVEQLTLDADLIASFWAPTTEIRDPVSSADNLAKLQNNARVTVACIFLANGDVLATYVRDSHEMQFPKLPPVGHRLTRNKLELVRPISGPEPGADPLGYIFITRDLNDLDDRLARTAMIVTVVLLISLLVTVVTAFWFQRVLTKPIEQLSTTMSAVGAGDLSARVEINRGDEIGDLAKTFNRMTEAIRETTVSRDSLLQSEQRLKLSLDAARAGTWSWDVRTNVVDWDERMEAIYGLEPGGFDGTYECWARTVFPEDLEHAEQSIQAAMSGEGEYDVEFRIHRADGETRTIAAQGVIERDKNDQPAQMTGVCVDVTERKQAREALRIAEARLNLAVTAGNVGIWDWDVRTNEVYFSPQFMAQLGCTREDFAFDFNDWKDRLHPEDSEAAMRTVTDYLEGRIDEYISLFRLRHKDGSYRWIMSQGELQHDDNGNPTRMIGVHLDITQQKEFEQQLKESAENLARSNKELDDFAYIASHDLKEPLRGINNYATFIHEDYHDRLEDDGKTKLETIQRLCKRMESLIDTLLKFSRVGRVDMAIERTDLNKVLEDVIDSLHVRLDEEGIDVRIPNPLPTITCDQARIGEVFRNLITNALKYNDKDEKWIEIGSEQTGKSGPSSARTFYVKDNGIGIREKHLDSVFQIFKRLHGRDKFGGGTGAGLTIVKKIIERHGGQIWVESVVGEGTTFYFTLEDVG